MQMPVGRQVSKDGRSTDYATSFSFAHVLAVGGTPTAAKNVINDHSGP